MSSTSSVPEELDLQVLGALDIDEVYGFAAGRLETQVPDETKRMFASWQAAWRKEALEHYLKLGWSFIARRDGKAVGFFLAQPFLFFRGQTQTLWVEHLDAAGPDIAHTLIDVAVRVAREKHLQRVLFANPNLDQISNNGLSRWHPQPLEATIAEVRTTKG